jgi:hypothetical protein
MHVMEKVLDNVQLFRCVKEKRLKVNREREQCMNTLSFDVHFSVSNGIHWIWQHDWRSEELDVISHLEKTMELKTTHLSEITETFQNARDRSLHKKKCMIYDVWRHNRSLFWGRKQHRSGWKTFQIIWNLERVSVQVVLYFQFHHLWTWIRRFIWFMTMSSTEQEIEISQIQHRFWFI